MADEKPEIAAASEKPQPPAPSDDRALGKYLTAMRERRGLTREQVSAEAHVPAHYVKMIETDSYGLVSDQLYVVPFMRRYAALVGADPEEIVSRFVREVQRAESSVVRIAEPMRMVTHETHSGLTRQLILGALIAVVLFAIATLVMRRLEHKHEESPPAASSRIDTPPALMQHGVGDFFGDPLLGAAHVVVRMDDRHHFEFVG
jgi:cytoskeletal protein RodZ